MSDFNKLSTTQLAKQRGIAPNELFAQLQSLGFIQKTEGEWSLTKAGEQLGGVYLTGKHGQFVAWPEDIVFEASKDPATGRLLTATALGKHFDVAPNKANYILSELGWIKKGLKGWLVTEQGAQLGAVQDEDPRSGIPYVRWPESILKAKSLLDSMDTMKGVEPPKTDGDKADGFRQQEEQAIYRKYNFNLIELGDQDVMNLDDILLRALLKFGVQAY